MDARPKTGQVNREGRTPPPQAPCGAKQIVIPMIRQQYDGIWQDAERMRAFVDEWAQLAPELFPEDFDQGYCLHGFGRESRKLPGLKLRKIVLADGTPYWLRPSFGTSYMTGTVDQLAYPLLLAAHGVPPGGKSGGTSGVRDIRCQFIILEGNPGRESGADSPDPGLPGPDYAPDTGLRPRLAIVP